MNLNLRRKYRLLKGQGEKLVGATISARNPRKVEIIALHMRDIKRGSMRFEQCGGSCPARVRI